MSDADIGICDILQPICGPVTPYGTPIRQASAISATAGLARKALDARSWLAAHRGHPAAGDVTVALAELETALAAV